MMDKNDFYPLAKSYLESNACGMWDGALKASTHRQLCELFVSERLNISLRKASVLFFGTGSIAGLVRKATLSLTDNLDEETIKRLENKLEKYRFINDE